MKKFLTISLIFFGIIFLAGCEKQSVKTTPVVNNSPKQDESETAKNALINFFDYLNRNEFEKALTVFNLDDPNNSWEGLESFSLPEERSNKAKVLENYCKAVGTCLEANVLEIKEVTSGEYNLVVQFLKSDGNIFIQGPCCGETEETMPSINRFDFRVKKINNTFKVLTPPVYMP